MKKLLILIAAFGFLISPPVSAMQERIQYLPRESITIQTQAGKDYIFDVEIARTGEEHKLGLMYRTHLNIDSGMLFLFDDEENRSFWMRDTLIPLDMLFIRKDGIIMHIHHNAIPQDESQVASGGPAMAVLEVNGGVTDNLNIKEGDRIIHKAFRNVLAPQ